MNVSPAVMAILDRCALDGPFLRLPPQQLDRKLYTDVDKVLRLAGGQWNRKLRAHQFEGDAIDAMDQVLLTGTIVDKRQALGFFETPAPIVDRMLDLAQIEREHVTLEPSAGRGAIARCLAPLVTELHCVEIDAAYQAELRVSIGRDHRLWEADFLTWSCGQTFDRIVMNPPFARQADARHVMCAARMLRPGGRLVSVVSSSAPTRANKAGVAFGAFLHAAGASVFALPEGSFHASGTDVNTAIVSFDYASGVTDCAGVG